MPGSTSPVTDIPACYQLLEEVGRGGMGVVWRAYDVRLDREVAIKVLRPDLACDAVAVRRFVTEARITGQLQHPGIPAVHELGTLPDGRPFLAMKLVRGRTLHELLKSHEASPTSDASPSRDRQGAADPAERGRFLAAFEQICHAVGYAHAHRVIHRDLKPSNIMVGRFGEVQVMDWGVAKVLPPNRPAEETRFQAPDQDTIGNHGEENESLQAGGAPGDPGPGLVGKMATEAHKTVSLVLGDRKWHSGDSATRTGSLLGTTAYMPPEQAAGRMRLLDARSDVFGLGAILCQILTGRPPYVGQDEQAVWIMALRGQVADAFAALDSCRAEPELVALCKRCLAFRQADRPADGNAVALEVARIRQAAEERARQAELEQQRALVREAEQRKRRRLAIAAAGTIGALLLTGLGGSLWQMHRAIVAEAQARLNEQRALANAERERLAKLEAEEQRQKAERNLAYAKKGNQILGLVFAGLHPRSVAESGRPLHHLLRDHLARAVKELEGSAIGDPLEVVEMQNTLGLSLLGLGEADLAIEVFHKALDTRTSQLGPDHPETLQSMNNLAGAYQNAGLIGKALPLLEQTLRLRRDRLGADHPDTLVSMNNLAGAYRAAGQLDKVRPLLEETLQLRSARLGPDHPDTLTSLNNLASFYFETDQPAQALPLLEQTFLRRKAQLGAEHPITLISMNNLAMAYKSLGQMDKALPLLEEARSVSTARLGPDHPHTLVSRNNLALAYRASGQLDKAIALWQETAEIQKTRLGPDHPDTLRSMKNLAVAYRAAGQPDKALPLLEDIFPRHRVALGPVHPDTLDVMNTLAATYFALGRHKDALPLHEQAAQGVEQRAFRHTNARKILGDTIRAHEAAGQFDQAQTWRRKWLDHVRSASGSESPEYAGELATQALSLTQQKRWAEAEPLLRECLAIREKTQPEAWTTFHTMSLLGQAVLGQKNYTDAERLLLKGYEGLRTRQATMPSDVRRERLGQALDRLIELYTALDRSDEGQKWQAEKAALPQ
jgi:serine/threonine protein kinase